MKRYELIKQYLEEQDNDTLVTIWNEHARECCPDDEIFPMDDINEILCGQSAEWLLDRMYYGDFKPCEDFFRFNGYGNLESCMYCNVTDWIFISDLAQYIDEEENDLGDEGLAEILEAEDDEDN